MRNKIYLLKEKIYKLKIVMKILPFILLLFFALYDVPINESWSTWSLPLTGNIIIIDPGHGGFDGGASSKSGVVEKDITLNISMYLRDYLNEAGAFVIMTRDSDVDLVEEYVTSSKKLTDLKNRVNLANKSMGDLFISIHVNSITSGRWRGAQTFYYSAREGNKLIAEFIQEQLIVTMENTDRKAMPRDDILVLKYVDMPSAMVEVGFLSNPSEAELLSTSEYQRKIAYSVYQGILTYYADKESVNENDN